MSQTPNLSSRNNHDIDNITNSTSVLNEEMNVQIKTTISIKLVLLGEAAVGKSSLVSRFTLNDFVENREPTIGAAFMTHKLTLDDKLVKFEIWDTAGQERFHSLAPMYYRNALAAVVVYDVAKKDTFERAKLWIKELQRQASSNIVIALAGNKADLKQDNFSNENQQSEIKSIKKEDFVDVSEVKDYAQENVLLFYETSAKTGQNIVALFEEIARKLPFDELNNNSNSRLNSGNRSINLLNNGGLDALNSYNNRTNSTNDPFGNCSC